MLFHHVGVQYMLEGWERRERGIGERREGGGGREKGRERRERLRERIREVALHGISYVSPCACAHNKSQKEAYTTM
jgi:hypothetical protein